MPDEHDEDDPHGEPPHPLDRVWFHPSELSAYMATSPTPAAPRPWGFAVVAAALGAVVTAGILAVVGAFDGSTTIEQSRLFAVSGEASDVAEVVEQAAPSVVGVVVQTGMGPLVGSGVVLGRRQVLTSASLFASATGRITVSTPDGRVLPARELGSDGATDLSLLVVDVDRGGRDLTAARLGGGETLAVGQSIVALGIAGGDHRWVGQGVVNAIDRVVAGSGGSTLSGMVETDVHPGNAVGGGALLDASGAVVGILSRAAPGHAVPIDVAKDVVEQLESSGRVEHGWLGADAADAADRPGGGARVTAVTSGGPAEKAGMAVGDVIIRVGSDRVTDMADLVAAVARRRPGDPVGIVFWRGNRHLRREVDLGEPAPLAPVTANGG